MKCMRYGWDLRGQVKCLNTATKTSVRISNLREECRAVKWCLLGQVGWGSFPFLCDRLLVLSLPQLHNTVLQERIIPQRTSFCFREYCLASNVSSWSVKNHYVDFPNVSYRFHPFCPTSPTVLIFKLTSRSRLPTMCFLYV